MLGRIGIGVRRAADDAAANPKRVDHQLVGSRVVDQSLLEEDANFEVDGPGLDLDQRPDSFQATQPDDGIDLEVSVHMGGALENALLQRLDRALGYLGGLKRLLCFGDFANCFLKGSLFGDTAIQQA